MNFSGISNTSFIGRLLRLPLKALPSGAVVPVMQGPLRGKKWIAGSSTHGCWLGSYEHSKQEMFRSFVKPGDTVFDVGANVGFYTLLAAVLTGETGKVFAFEPLPSNVKLLNRHMSLNKVQNVKVIEAAVSDASGECCFQEMGDNSMGKLAQSGRLRVKTVCLDGMLANGELALPQLIKIDVEGAELSVLQGAHNLLRQHRPKLFLATHGEQVHKACCELLSNIGYTLRPISGGDILRTDEVLAL